jgi:hypothetical protein
MTLICLQMIGKKVKLNNCFFLGNELNNCFTTLWSPWQQTSYHWCPCFPSLRSPWQQASLHWSEGNCPQCSQYVSSGEVSKQFPSNVFYSISQTVVGWFKFTIFIVKNFYFFLKYFLFFKFIFDIITSK